MSATAPVRVQTEGLPACGSFLTDGPGKATFEGR